MLGNPAKAGCGAFVQPSIGEADETTPYSEAMFQDLENYSPSDPAKRFAEHRPARAWVQRFSELI